jgi:hypothetical protein
LGEISIFFAMHRFSNIFSSCVVISILFLKRGNSLVGEFMPSHR